jgi:undecaprenyl diphosphate synthase
MHVGIIPDGHRRWAKKRGVSFPRAYDIGLAKGIDILMHLCEHGVKCISMYALSNDNYERRPREEIEAFISQISESMNAVTPKLLAGEIQVRIIGNIDGLLQEHQKKIRNIEGVLSRIRSPRAEMNVLVNYSLSWDLSGTQGKQHTEDIRDCDLVFRSGGVKRLSGFLPKQSAYAELFFTPKLWPDVTCADFDTVISEYRKINRSFGA